MKILTILNQDKKQVKAKNNERLAKALKRNQEALIDSVEAKRDELQDKLDFLLTKEGIEQAGEDWNDVYHNAKLELEMTTVSLQVAKETLNTLFSDKGKDEESK